MKKLARFPKARRSISTKSRPFRLKCNVGNFQCGARCTPVTYTNTKGKRAYTKCAKNPTGMAKDGLQWLQYVEDRKRRAEKKFGGQFTTDDQGNVIRSGKVADPWYGKPSEASATKAVTKPTVNTPTTKALPPAKEVVKAQTKPLPSPDTPIAAAELNDFFARKYKGDVTAAELKNNWERLKRSEAALKKEMSARNYTIAKIAKDYRLSPRYGVDKKSEWVEYAIERMKERFLPKQKSTIINIYERKTKEQIAADRDKLVDSWTDEMIEADAIAVAESNQERRDEIEKRNQAMANPQTLADFRNILYYKGKEALTPEQSEKYDELLALAGRETRKQQEEADRQKQLKADESMGDLAFGMVEGFHTKHNQPLFTVTMNKWVDDLDPLKAIAKEAGGYYYKAWGKTPKGFQFRSSDRETAKANAEKFIEKASKLVAGKRSPLPQAKIPLLKLIPPPKNSKH